LDEIKLLKCVRTADGSDVFKDRTVQLLDDFQITGINGTHVCMVFEVLGHNLLKFIIRSDYQGIPLHNVKIIIKQVLEGLEYLHNKCKIIHTDIKPENILVCVDNNYIRRIAAEATYHYKLGHKLPSSAVSSAPAEMLRHRNRSSRTKTRRKLGSSSSNPEDSVSAGAAISNVAVNSMSLPEVSTGGCAVSEEHLSAATGGCSGALRDPGDGLVMCGGQRDDLICPEHQMGSTMNSNSKDDFWTESMEEEVVNFSSNKLKEDPVLQVCPNLEVKIADLGNACWIDHHFTEDIQTRQYRALEVLLGSGYGCPADIWSTACMAFELATGDYLFEPHSGEDYSRDEDHLAHIIELIGPIPKHIAFSGRYSKEFFRKNGELRHINMLKPWSLFDVLIEKYEWDPKIAQDFADWLMPMLHLDPSKRASATECLNDKFLDDI